MSRIEWTEATYNPTTGCRKLSAGCDNCYANTMANRLKAMGQADYKDGFALRVHDHRLKATFSKHPFNLSKPSLVFVNSMSDLFHKDVPLDFIQRVFSLFTHPRGARHTYQILTKRAARLEHLAPKLYWPANVWQGVSVESARHLDRVNSLRNVPAAVRFLSCEPLLGPLPKLNLDGIHWVIVGGESGHGARPMHPDWARDIRNQCVAARVPFLFKQWGAWAPASKSGDHACFLCGNGKIIKSDWELADWDIDHDSDAAYMVLSNKKANGRILDGRTWDEYPAREVANV